MKKQHIIYLIAGVAALILIAGGWYAYKYHECVKEVSYVPSREQKTEFGGSGYTLGRIADKGDYYLFFSQKFKTSEDAIRACIWK